jgi:hypothetical protein
MTDMVNHPPHYNALPAGIECIDVVEHFDFVIGNVIKYAWRAGLKPGTGKLQDLRKMAWYAQRAVEREEMTIAAESPKFFPGEYCPQCNSERTLIKVDGQCKCFACGYAGETE